MELNSNIQGQVPGMRSEAPPTPVQIIASSLSQISESISKLSRGMPVDVRSIDNALKALHPFSKEIDDKTHRVVLYSTLYRCLADLVTSDNLKDAYIRSRNLLSSMESFSDDSIGTMSIRFAVLKEVLACYTDGIKKGYEIMQIHLRSFTAKFPTTDLVTALDNAALRIAKRAASNNDNEKDSFIEHTNDLQNNAETCGSKRALQETTVQLSSKRARVSSGEGSQDKDEARRFPFPPQETHQKTGSRNLVDSGNTKAILEDEPSFDELISTISSNPVLALLFKELYIGDNSEELSIHQKSFLSEVETISRQVSNVEDVARRFGIRIAIERHSSIEVFFVALHSALRKLPKVESNNELVQWASAKLLSSASNRKSPSIQSEELITKQKNSTSDGTTAKAEIEVIHIGNNSPEKNSLGITQDKSKTPRSLQKESPEKNKREYKQCETCHNISIQRLSNVKNIAFISSMHVGDICLLCYERRKKQAQIQKKQAGVPEQGQLQRSLAGVSNNSSPVSSLEVQLARRALVGNRPLNAVTCQQSRIPVNDRQVQLMYPRNMPASSGISSVQAPQAMPTFMDQRMAAQIQAQNLRLHQALGLNYLTRGMRPPSGANTLNSHSLHDVSRKNQ